MSYRIIVMFPTWTEARPFAMRHGEIIEVVKAGVGLAECGARTAAVITARRPDLLILAGIAGAYEGSGIEKGETVLITRENSADLGSVHGGKFRPLAKSGGDPADNFYSTRNEFPPLFSHVTSNSVNTHDHTRPLHSLLEAQVENMEGAAFMAVCNALGVDCAEIRTVSNIVGEEPERWVVPQAVETLAHDVALFIDTIKTKI